MLYKICADFIVIIHFVWILFILLGFGLTTCSFVSVCILRKQTGIWDKFFDRWLFRSIHMFGIAYVGLLAVLGKYCPITILENFLRQRYNPETKYPGSFIAHYIEKLVYPRVHPLAILIPTATVAILTIIVFIIRPPRKIKALLTRKVKAL